MAESQLKLRGLGRIVAESADNTRWAVYIHVLAEDTAGHEEVVGEVVVRGFNYGPDVLRAVLAQAADLATKLIAMKTTRIQPATVVPLVPPGKSH